MRWRLFARVCYPHRTVDLPCHSCNTRGPRAYGTSQGIRKWGKRPKHCKTATISGMRKDTQRGPQVDVGLEVIKLTLGSSGRV
jgi:hypothetical protein